MWAYSGEPEVAADSAFGGSIRVGTDFTNNVNDSWSEVKLENGSVAEKPLAINGYNTLSFKKRGNESKYQVLFVFAI